MSRCYNFGAGPSMLPEPILREVQDELLNWNNLGISILEIGHRTPEFMALMEQTELAFRELLNVPTNYHLLFLGGAARTQFSMIPMNLLAVGEQAGYLITGLWSAMAYQEAAKIKQAYCVASDEEDGFIKIPPSEQWQIQENTKYLYFTPNETVNGVRFSKIPNISGLPLIADMTSSLLSEPITISDYGLIFAGAQKNIANAGLTLVIVRDELLKWLPSDVVPTMFDYRTHSSTHSLYATPPTFNCYLAGKMAEWVKAQGGIAALYELNCIKASKLYSYIDASNFYHCKISPEARSLVNVCFSLSNPNLEKLFLEAAKARGLLALKGHRTVGGLRASMYNAMPLEAVECLIKFMRDFEKEHNQ